MTENQERAEQARSAFTVNGGNVQILPNATIAIQNIHWGDGTDGTLDYARGIGTS